jgi:hypothetical protein
MWKGRRLKTIPHQAVAGESSPRTNTAWVALRPWVPAVAAVVVMRARFVVTPLTSDEGGYLGVARAWRHGATLYNDVWVDRPQGLLVLFRALDVIGLGSPVGVRLMAVVIALVGVVACGSIAATLAGQRAKWIAALTVGVLVSVPQYEGFLANSELISCSIGAVSLALLLRAVWDTDVADRRLLVFGGLAAGCALSTKQSGFDAFAAGVVTVVAIGVVRRWKPRDVASALATIAAGLAIPITLMVVHGALTGWHRWWYAVAGYRLEQRSAVVGADWSRFVTTYSIVAPVLLPTLIVIGVLAVVLGATHRDLIGPIAVLTLWTLFATVAFLMGGQFHRHYWLIVMFPLGTFAGVLVARIPNPGARAIVLLLLLAIPARMTASGILLPRDQVGVKMSGDARPNIDEKVAEWFHDHSVAGDQIYAMCWSAGLYGDISADPPYPYLWQDGVLKIPGATRKLVDLLSGADSPRFIARYQDPGQCDATGTVTQALATHYRRVDTAGGIAIYERTTKR